MAKVVQLGGTPGQKPKTRQKKAPEVPPVDEHLVDGVGSEAEALDAENKSQSNARAAVALRLSGASYPEIAMTLDYTTPTAARIAVEGMLAAAYDEETDYKSLRNVASARLEKLMKSLAGKAFNPKDPDHLAYARQFLSVADRHIKLHGIDAPQMVSVINPSAEEFERVVGALAQKALADQPQEADIGVLEQIEDADIVDWEDSDDEPEDDDS